jgi:predicted AlkP superfamily phosphohydrolase/phosphomutase
MKLALIGLDSTAPDWVFERFRGELPNISRTDPHGRNIGSKAYRPEELYREVKGGPPDLIVYFGDLHWRSVGSLGLRSVHTFENDTGPDEVNHDWHGIFLMNGAGCRRAALPQGQHAPMRLYDVGPTVLALYGLEPNPGGVGTPIGLGLP